MTLFRGTPSEASWPRESFTVSGAEPVEKITREVLLEIAAARDIEPALVTVDEATGVLTINADNQRLVYVIDWDSWDGSTYTMRWPD